MAQQKILGIIPARLKSTRLPEKMLKLIAGKPLIYHTWNQVKKAKLLDEVVIATDSPEIEKAVKEFGGMAIMTSEKHQCGSDRVAEAARLFTKFVPDIIVNIQGDEPVLSPEAVDSAVQVLLDNPEAPFGTTLIPFKNDAQIDEPSGIKVITTLTGRVIYCSRSRIPYPREPYAKYLKQLGIYAFRRDMLQTYVNLPQTPLELAEGLEQLRMIEHGYPIQASVGDYISISVDTAEDLERVRKILEK